MSANLSSVPASVYAIAFACSPGRGSEEGVGWNMAKALAMYSSERHVPVTVVTPTANVEHVEAGLVALGLDTARVRVVGVRFPAWAMSFTSEWLLRAGYLAWQYVAVRRVRRMLLQGKGAESASGMRPIVHHLTYATEAIPTFEATLRNHAAWVVGPVGSAAVSKETGGLSLRFQLRRFIRGRLAARNLGADVLVATNESTVRQWALSARGKALNCHVEPNVMLDPAELPITAPRKLRTFDVVIAGVLTKRKGVDFGIRALGATGRELSVAVVGDGPERSRLERIASQYPRMDVRFLGKVTREVSLRVIADSRVLLHAAIQEGSPWVVGEAQALGTPPVVWAGAGGDSIVKIGGIGTVVANRSVESLARAVTVALDDLRDYSDLSRWSIERMPTLLSRWYSEALGVSR